MQCRDERELRHKCVGKLYISSVDLNRAILITVGDVDFKKEQISKMAKIHPSQCQMKDSELLRCLLEVGNN